MKRWRGATIAFAVLATPIAAERRRAKVYADWDPKLTRPFPADRTTRAARLPSPPIVPSWRPW